MRMTASKPKKVNRTIDLNIDPDQTFLMYEENNGGILWKKAVPFSRDDAGKLWVDITDLLREIDLPITFCEQGTLRHYKARPYELWRTMDVFSWGRKSTWDGFAYDSTAGATLSFFQKAAISAARRSDTSGWRGLAGRPKRSMPVSAPRRAPAGWTGRRPAAAWRSRARCPN